MIITQDRNNSIILGDLVVNDYEGLKEIRDYFMQYRLDNGNYSRFVQGSRVSFRSILPTDYMKKVPLETKQEFTDLWLMIMIWIILMSVIIM